MINMGLWQMLAAGAPLDTGTYIFFTILAFLVMIGLSVLFVFKIRKDLIISKHSGSEKGLMSVDRFKTVVETLCRQNSKKLKYAIFRIDIRHLDDVKKVVGEDQMEAIYAEMVATILKLAPWGIRLTRASDKTFYVVMNINEEKTIDNQSQLLINNLSKEYEIGTDMLVAIMINVAAANIPEAGKTIEELKNSLDITMIMSKRRGENCYVLYNIKYINENTEEYKYYHEIKDAIANKEFILHYQPVIDIKNLEVVSAETVIRWTHKTKGILPPSEFLNIMEQTGDINWVGCWCFDKMLAQFASWQSNYEQKFTVSYNLSERQLLNADLANEFKKYIKKNKIEPNSILLEIADLAMYNMSDIVKNNIDKLSQFGIKICFDGFGSKYSSLTALQDFPIDTIKLHKNFWSKINESIINKDSLKILVEYAKEKNVMLIAVGVEDKDEIDLLKANGIEFMQGFAFSKPKDPKDFIADVVFTPWTETLKEQPATETKNAEKTKKQAEKDAE